MRRWAAFGLMILFSGPTRASAYDLRLGYQLGLSQTFGTTVSDTGAVAPGATPNDDTAVNRTITGFQLTTALTGNVSADILTSTFDHGIVAGGSISQLIIPQEEGRLRTNIFGANLNYVSRLQRPLYGLAFGAGYSVTSNGRSCSAANGAVDAICPRPDINNQAGTYVITGLAHQATGTAQLQLTRRRWDFNLQTTYTFSENAAYSLATGVGAQATASNIGGFLRVRSHAVSPLASFRTRVGRSGVLNIGALSTYTLQIEPQDATITGTTAMVAAQLPLPTTWNNSAQIGYVHSLTTERAIGGEINASMNFRVAQDPNTQEPFKNEGPTPDSLIFEAVATYSDFLPWELRVNLDAGVAQPTLFQPPLGRLVTFPSDFETVRGGLEFVFNASVQRFFDPINATLSAGRNVTVGALGISAVVNEQASLALQYQPEIFGRVAQVNLGFNVQQTGGIGSDPSVGLATGCDPSGVNGPLCTPEQLILLAFNNRGFGINVAVGAPLFQAGDLAGAISATYNMNWLDPDPQGRLDLDHFVTHTALAQISLNFGRGPLARDGLGFRETDELDAFSMDPRSGSPLVSSRLITQGAPMLSGTEGAKPGQPPAPRRDSRQEYEQSKRQQAVEAEARKRADVVQGSGSIQEEEQRAQQQEAAAREERGKRRTRKFSEWPAGAMIAPGGLVGSSTVAPAIEEEEEPAPKW